MPGHPDLRDESAARRWLVPIGLIAATFVSTLYAGTGWANVEVNGPLDLLRGWTFAVPLMAILLAHEFGHYIAGRIHRIDISPPFFIPVPVVFGTFGAVIRMRSEIKRRNALLDVGAAGPLAGLAVALPVLIFGIATSRVEPIPEGVHLLIEGRSILYLSLLYLLKGPIPEGHDIMLSPTALAGWVGLLITMINLVPVGQLDGGHIAYALFGKRQDEYARRVRRVLPAIALVTGLAYGIPALAEGKSQEELVPAFLAGMHWLVWAFLLYLMARFTGPDHPPTEDTTLSPARRAIAVLNLVLFVLLFMPSWLREG